jgi:hypothetical protein
VDCSAAKAANAYAAAVGRSKALQNLDRAGLARAVGPEEAENLAFIDGEAYPAQGFNVSVALGKVVNFNGGGVQHGFLVYNTILWSGGNGEVWKRWGIWWCRASASP